MRWVGWFPARADAEKGFKIADRFVAVGWDVHEQMEKVQSGAREGGGSEGELA